MFYSLPLSHIHIELTTKCNAACPMCMRNLNGDVDHPNLIKTDFDVNVAGGQDHLKGKIFRVNHL